MLKNLEHKTLSFEPSTLEGKGSIEALQSRIMSGFSASWSQDLGGDVIHRGAFLDAIARRFTASNRERGWPRIRFMLQHKEVIGLLRTIREEDKGLYVECYFSKTTLGNDTLILVADHALDQMSIGFIATEFYYDGQGPWNDGKGRRHITKMDLQEVSVVCFPMNEDTEILEVRSIDVLEGKVMASEPVEVAQEVSIIKKEATVLDFEFKELAHRMEQVKLELKKGAKLNASYTKSLLSVLGLVHEVLASALPQNTDPKGVQEENACPLPGVDDGDGDEVDMGFDPENYKGMDGAQAVREVMSTLRLGKKAAPATPAADTEANLAARKNPANTQAAPADYTGAEDYVIDSTLDGPGLDANSPNAEGEFEGEGSPLPETSDYQGVLDRISAMLASLK